MPPTIQPTITTLREVQQLPKMRSVYASQATTPTISWTMCDESGNPLVLTDYTDTDDYEVKLAVRQTMATRDEETYYSTGSITTAATGLVSAAVPEEAMASPGIYVAEIAIRTADEAATIQLINRFWLIVDRSLFGNTDHIGPPTIAEIRLHLRDFPEGNFLLDEYEFDPAEIAAAISRCVMFFNESAPPLLRRFTTLNFPYRYHWMEGIVSELFLTAAHHYRRNAAKSISAGLSTADLDKELEYMRAYQLHKQTWTDFVKRTKIAINMAEGYGGLGSYYGFGRR